MSGLTEYEYLEFDGEASDRTHIHGSERSAGTRAVSDQVDPGHLGSGTLDSWTDCHCGMCNLIADRSKDAFVDPQTWFFLPKRTGINKFLIATVYPYRTTLKLAFDIFLSILLLIVLTPLMLLIAYLVRRDGGPAIFAHQRVGENGKLFYCLKFRTMTVNSDIVLKRLLATDAAANEEWEQTHKLKHDPRITKIGTFLRRTSMDELPQLINVLRGEMNLVGPRPITTEEIPKYGSAIHDYYLCRPGVTGLWQVSGRNNVSYASRVRMDTFYSRKLSFRLDMAILIMTVKSVVSGRGAS